MTTEFAALLAMPLRSGFTVPAAGRGVGIKMVNMGELFRYPRMCAVEMTRVSRPRGADERVLVREHDLLFARRSLTLEGAGQCAIIIAADEDTTWESSIIRARVDPELADARFYFYYFRSPQGRRSIEAIVEQVAAAGIRLTELARLKVPVLPLPEQQAIAEVLGALDDKIAANGRLGSLLMEWASVKYRAAIQKVAWAPMSEALSPILGGTPSRARDDYWRGSTPWLSVRDVANASAGAVVDTIEHITELAVAETKSKPLPVGSVILTARGTIGEVARLSMPAAFNQSCYGFKPDALPAGVLYFAVLGAVDQMRRIAHGSVFDTITKRTFDHVQIPNLNEGEAAAIEHQIRPSMEAAEYVARESRKLESVRDALLPELMSGRLRVKDAERTVEEVL